MYDLKYVIVSSIKMEIMKNSDGKESVCSVGDLGLIPRSWEPPERRERLPIPVFLPGEFHEQRNLLGCIVHGVTKSRTWLSYQHFQPYKIVVKILFK